MKYESLSQADRITAEGQLGRELRGEVRIGSRCPFGRVEVLMTSPYVDGDTPFPTLFWLTCPLLQSRVSGLEHMDFRQGLKKRLAEDPAFAPALQKAESEYCEERRRWAEDLGSGPGLHFEGRTGIAGTRSGGMKCLHAHLAHYLAGRRNPIGQAVNEALGECQKNDCAGDCRPFAKRRAR
jgi:uncharacterized protein